MTMASKRSDRALVPRAEAAAPEAVPMETMIAVNYELLVALRDVSYGELAKGASTSGPAWRVLHDVISGILGDGPAAAAQPVKGRQPSVMPRPLKNPPAATNGAQPVWPGQAVHHGGPTSDVPAESPGNIRERADVAAELARVSVHTGGAK
jgi:hypothetical protein